MPLGQLPNRVLISDEYSRDAQATVFSGDRLQLLRQIPNEEAKLIITSPPYNLGKPYETKRDLPEYLHDQEETIRESVRVLHPRGSICWQVGNHIREGEVFPLDALLYETFKKQGLSLRNRIIWHFEHGLHSNRRFSGRYETILWFTKTEHYVFNLDQVRVPQKYPGKKAYKGPKAGEYSGNPLGKNPGDVWIIPNVKHNHPEKTAHPCQFPIELVQRLIHALTFPGDLVVDPYLGVGTTAAAAILTGRRSAGADIIEEYLGIARQRIQQAAQGALPHRTPGKPIYTAPKNSPLTRSPWRGK